MSAYSIRELERLSGIKAPTIRIWEKRYGVILPKRTSTNIRYYDDADLRKLINLAILNRNGHRISELAELDDNALQSMALEHCLCSEEQEDHIRSLTHAMIRVDEREFDRIFERLKEECGFEDCLLRIILPFLRQVGTLWHTCSIEPAQEHFASQLIRRKIMSAIEAERTPEREATSYLMFLPEGELHDICLLFGQYLARKEGYNVCYLGPSIPLEDLRKLARQYHYPEVLTAFINPISDEELREKLESYLSLFPDSTIHVTGPQTEGREPVNNDRLHVIGSVEAFRDMLLEKGSKELEFRGPASDKA